jgi:signal peptidase I
MTSFWKELVKLAVIAVVVVIPFRLFIAQPFVVDGASMDPTFADGEYLIVDELTYHFKSPERGSVLIFKYPIDPRKYFIKRVIGLPGETVSIKDGQVTVVNAENPEGITLEEPYVEFERNETATFVLGDGEYFVMGDNRAGSADSRLWGPVPDGNIVGRPVLRLWPPAILPGEIPDINFVRDEKN